MELEYKTEECYPGAGCVSDIAGNRFDRCIASISVTGHPLISPCRIIRGDCS